MKNNLILNKNLTPDLCMVTNEVFGNFFKSPNISCGSIIRKMPFLMMELFVYIQLRHQHIPGIHLDCSWNEDRDEVVHSFTIGSYVNCIEVQHICRSNNSKHTFKHVLDELFEKDRWYKDKHHYLEVELAIPFRKFIFIKKRHTAAEYPILYSMELRPIHVSTLYGLKSFFHLVEDDLQATVTGASYDNGADILYPFIQ